jgi:hypothetical protein
MSKDNNNPSITHPDTISLEHPHSDRTSSNHFKTRLYDFFKIMYSTGADAQDIYENALAALRQQPEDVIIEIARPEKECYESDYLVIQHDGQGERR